MFKVAVDMTVGNTKQNRRLTKPRTGPIFTLGSRNATEEAMRAQSQAPSPIKVFRNPPRVFFPPQSV